MGWELGWGEAGVSPQKRKASDKKTKSLFGLKLMVNLLWRKKQLRLWTLVSGCFSTNFCGLGFLRLWQETLISLDFCRWPQGASQNAYEKSGILWRWEWGRGRRGSERGKESQPGGGGDPSGRPQPPGHSTPRPEGLAPSCISSRVRRAPS